MRVALFLIAMSIADLAPTAKKVREEAYPILTVIFCVFVVMDILDFILNFKKKND